MQHIMVLVMAQLKNEWSQKRHQSLLAPVLWSHTGLTRYCTVKYSSCIADIATGAGCPTKPFEGFMTLPSENSAAFASCFIFQLYPTIWANHRVSHSLIQTHLGCFSPQLPVTFFCVSHKHHLTSVNYIILHHNLEYHKISQILKEHFGVQVPIIFPQSPRNASASLSLLITVAPCAPLPAAKPLVPDLLSLACGGRRGRKGH